MKGGFPTTTFRIAVIGSEDFVEVEMDLTYTQKSVIGELIDRVNEKSKGYVCKPKMRMETKK